MSREINAFLSRMQRAIDYRKMAYKNMDPQSREHILYFTLVQS
ncbi:hypothetical protein [Arachidicoccus soli]|nr:hypothetical protein [Arachidicoccus soli]